MLLYPRKCSKINPPFERVEKENSTVERDYRVIIVLKMAKQKDLQDLSCQWIFSNPLENRPRFLDRSSFIKDT